MKQINSLKNQKESIEQLKEIFLAARKAQIVYKKEEFSWVDLRIKLKEYESFSEETKSIIQNLFDYSMSNSFLENYNERLESLLDSFLYGDNEERQIQKLKIIIEGILFREFNEKEAENKREDMQQIKIQQEDEKETETHKNDEKKLEKQKKEEKFKESIEYLKKCYADVLQNLEQIQNKNSGEQQIIKFYRESKELKIYIDKEKETRFAYGKFLKLGREANLTLYKDGNMSLLRIANYQARKINLQQQRKITEKLILEEISKYQFQLNDEKGKTASMEFFAQTAIGDSILRGSKKAFKLMLAAACEAKAQGREFIGRISCIDKELGTFITTYDDKLEGAIQEIVEKENEPSEKTPKQKEQEGNQQPEGKE